MDTRQLRALFRHAEVLSKDSAESLNDERCLQLLITERSQPAFATLVHRHGPMVWAMCLHHLHNPSDAEDAFQAVFLTLFRSANSIRNPTALAAWLHGVTLRIALKLQRTQARRLRHERLACVTEPVEPIAEQAWQKAMLEYHAELDQLPESLKMAVLICDLQGVDQTEAAKRLGWKLGTLSGRLAKARSQIQDRLIRRGLAPALALSTITLTQSTASSQMPIAINHLVSQIMQASGPALSAIVITLSGEVVMYQLKWFKILLATTLVVGGIGTGVGVKMITDLTAQPPSATPGSPAKAVNERGLPNQQAVTPTENLNNDEISAYRIAIKPAKTQHFVELLQSASKQGWELAGITDYPQVTAEQIGKQHFIGTATEGTAIVIFRRGKVKTSVPESSPASPVSGSYRIPSRTSAEPGEKRVIEIPCNYYSVKQMQKNISAKDLYDTLSILYKETLFTPHPELIDRYQKIHDINDKNVVFRTKLQLSFNQLTNTIIWNIECLSEDDKMSIRQLVSELSARD